MIGKKHFAVLVVLALLLAVPAMSIAESDPYSHVIMDDEGDVTYWHGTGWNYGVERPNIDILSAEISESDGVVSISLTVKGESTDDADIIYQILSEGEGNGSYTFHYSDNSSTFTASNDNGYNIFEPEVSGLGTDTMLITCTLDDLLNPETLRLSNIITTEHTEDGHYQDTALPDDDTPPYNGSSDFQPVNMELDVHPVSGEVPLEVTISISAENIGEDHGEINVIIDSSVEYVLELPAGDENSHEFAYTFFEEGSYPVVFGDEIVTVIVDDNGDIDDDDPDPEEILDEFLEKGKLCLALIIIISIVIVVIIIIILVKFLKKDKKGDQEHPPQQGYQQPPPGAQGQGYQQPQPTQPPRPPEQNYQEPPPPTEPATESETPPEDLEDEGFEE
ncbi:MAG: hypothetical protein R6U17_09765 [Thermoplasmata archaeon]